MASRSWCQITPLIQSCIVLSGVLGPQLAKLLQLETPRVNTSKTVRVKLGLLIWLCRCWLPKLRNPERIRT